MNKLAFDGNGVPWNNLLCDKEDLLPHIEESLRNGDFPVIEELQHSSECHAQMDRQQAILDAWVAQYPHYCRCCNAEGGTQFPGRLYEGPDFVPCRACVQRGKCPRCGVSGFLDYSPCGACGYEFDDKKPGIPYCICHQDEPVPADWRDPFLPEELDTLYDKDVCPDLTIDRRFV